jgi:hypothetical protein
MSKVAMLPLPNLEPIFSPSIWTFSSDELSSYWTHISLQVYDEATSSKSRALLGRIPPEKGIVYTNTLAPPPSPRLIDLPYLTI